MAQVQTRALTIPEQARRAIAAHCLSERPNEACGLVAVDEERRVRMVYCLTNTDGSPDTYTVDPAEHIGALRHAERCGWELGGVFHSHPNGPAVLSPTDIAGALEPEWIYLVVGEGRRGAHTIRGYRVTAGSVAEVDVTCE